MEIIEKFCKDRGIEYLKDEPMKNHTSFKIGGACDMYIVINTVNDLKLLLALAKNENIPYMIIGNGSNLLVHDKGLEGLVIRLKGDFTDIKKSDDVRIIAGSGAKLADVCIFARNNELSGLEFAYGIPGSAGGGVYMNAGAYDGEMKNVVESVVYLNSAGNICQYKGDELDFSYRNSVFKRTDDIILFVTYRLIPGRYEDISSKMNDFMDRRRTKQPLEYPSAGSVFKRPEGNYAGALIQQCGLKGMSIGGAEVSEKHSGFIINTGNATCDDVLSLVDYVQKTVKEKTGYYLEREIIDIGK